MWLSGMLILVSRLDRTSDQDEEGSPNVLLSLQPASAADDPELKCMAINKVRDQCREDQSCPSGV